MMMMMMTTLMITMTILNGLDDDVEDGHGDDNKCCQLVKDYLPDPYHE